MTIPIPMPAGPPLALWGGVEATVNRVGERYFSQMDLNGHAHAERIDDLDRFAALGIQALRYPVLWELVAPNGLAQADWRWTDQRLGALHRLGVTPIAGLVHHGSGPRHTSLLDPAFPEQLAQYAGAVARRYPWLSDYTPVNEPCTTARFSCLYGLWYPHQRDAPSFVRALLNQCKATVLAMQAIRTVNPQARLIQTDDLGKTYSTPELAAQAAFNNHRRWLPWDLLCGMVQPGHALWNYLQASGATSAELLWFAKHRCPPDIIGINYYITSERWLDHRSERYQPGDVGAHGYADVAAARTLHTPCPGIAPLLMEAWQRYRLPLAVTEAHIDARREDQLRWLHELWQGAQHAQRQGADVRAVTAWALLGAFDWNTLVTERNGYYENGAYDLRSTPPRATALTTLMRELSSARPPSNPVLHGPGWWRRPQRLLYLPSACAELTDTPADNAGMAPALAPPILLCGDGALADAFVRLCAERHLSCRVLTRQDIDLHCAASVEAAIVRHQPWAIINASGHLHATSAAADSASADDAAPLAAACARHAIALLHFSSDHVFDGSTGRPCVESDPPSPPDAFGRSEVNAEQRTLSLHPAALVVRTGPLFGPWDRRNLVMRTLQALRAGQPLAASGEQLLSPTYLPDLVHACLDLLIDGESGMWHLSNGNPLSWPQLAQRLAELAGMPFPGMAATSPGQASATGARYSALTSERGQLMPSLDAALRHFLDVVGVFEKACYNCAPWPGSSVGRAED